MIDKISRKDYDLCLKYYELSKNENFDVMIKDLERNVIASKTKIPRGKNMESVFENYCTINGFDNCRAYIITKINIVNDVKKGKIKVIGEDIEEY